jgi:hypothetical protein
VVEKYPDTPSGRYRREADRLDAALDTQLADVRRREEGGEISPLTAARERIEALERHLAETKALRELYFGTGEGSSSERPG